MAKEYVVKSGLGGWLILVGLGVIISPFYILTVIPEFLPIFQDNMYDELVSAAPLFGLFLWTEIVVNLIIFLGSIYLIFLFFAKKTFFPKFYIWFVFGSLAFVIVDAIVGGMLFKEMLPDEPFFDSETIKEIARGLITTIIWVPYMMVSKRVKATFVK